MPESLFRNISSVLGRTRTDLNALAEFIEARDSGGSVDSLKLIKLFWHTFRPSTVSTYSSGPVGRADEEPRPLPDDLDDVFLDLFAELERGCRIPYVPDSDDSPESSSLRAYIHVGAAFALRQRRRDNFSEDVRQTLKEVWRSLCLVERQGDIDLFPFPHEVGPPSQEAISLYGVAALILSELFHIKCLDRNYEEALLDAQVILWTIGFVEEASIHPRPSEVRRIFAEVFGTDFHNKEGIDDEENLYQTELEIYETVKACCPTQCLTPQQIVDAFEGLRMNSGSKDWKRVAELCEEFVSNLEYSEDKSLLLESVTGMDGREEPWILYWRGAEAWLLRRWDRMSCATSCASRKETPLRTVW